MKLHSLMYAEERNNWNYERFVTDHKDQHTILEWLTNYGYNGLDDTTKFTLLMDDMKVDSLDTVKAMTTANSYFLRTLTIVSPCIRTY